MADRLDTEVLRLAARILGGPRNLLARLEASAADVEAWLAGTREPPREVLLKALEVILDELDERD